MISTGPDGETWLRLPEDPFESDASSFFTTVYSVLYGKTDADFQCIIDQESTPKTENRTKS